MFFLLPLSIRGVAAALRGIQSVAVAVLLLFAFSLVGCGGGGGGKGGAASDTVTGTVKDSANSDAVVVGATVKIGGASAVTGSDGSFTLTNVSIGSATAAITPSAGTAQTVAFSPSIVSGANTALELFINIGQISGTVDLPGGSAASGAFVSNSSDADSVATNSDGTFLLINVPTGSTTLTFALGTASATKTVTVGNGVTNVGTITLVQSTDPNPPAAPYDVSGTVLDSGGTAAAGIEVFLLQNGVQLETAYTDTTGKYTFYIPVGSYTLQAQQSNYQTGTTTFTVSTPSTALTVPALTLQSQ